MKVYETITAENWKKGSSGCLIYHMLGIGIQGDDGTILNTREYASLRDVVATLFPTRISAAGSFTSVYEFNDHPDTTVEDVIRVCKVADV